MLMSHWLFYINSIPQCVAKWQLQMSISLNISTYSSVAFGMCINSIYTSLSLSEPLLSCTCPEAFVWVTSQSMWSPSLPLHIDVFLSLSCDFFISQHFSFELWVPSMLVASKAHAYVMFCGLLTGGQSHSWCVGGHIEPPPIWKDAGVHSKSFCTTSAHTAVFWKCLNALLDIATNMYQ